MLTPVRKDKGSSSNVSPTNLQESNRILQKALEEKNLIPRGRGLEGLSISPPRFSSVREESSEYTPLTERLELDAYTSDLSYDSPRVAKTNNLISKEIGPILEESDSMPSISSGEFSTGDVLARNLSRSNITPEMARAADIVIVASTMQNSDPPSIPANQEELYDYLEFNAELELEAEEAASTSRKRPRVPTTPDSTSPEIRPPPPKKRRIFDIVSSPLFMDPDGEKTASDLYGTYQNTSNNTIVGGTLDYDDFPEPVSKSFEDDISLDLTDELLNSLSGDSEGGSDEFDLARAIAHTKAGEYDSIIGQSAALNALPKTIPKKSTVEKEKSEYITSSLRRELGVEEEFRTEMEEEEEEDEDLPGHDVDTSISTSEEGDKFGYSDDSGEIYTLVPAKEGKELDDIDDTEDLLEEMLKKGSKNIQQQEEAAESTSKRKKERGENIISKNPVRERRQETEELKQLNHSLLEKIRGLVYPANQEMLFDTYFSEKSNLIQDYGWIPTNSQKKLIVAMHSVNQKPRSNRLSKEFEEELSEIDRTNRAYAQRLIDNLMDDTVQVIHDILKSSYQKLLSNIMEEYAILLIGQRERFIADTIPETVETHFEHTELVVNGIIEERKLRWYPDNDKARPSTVVSIIENSSLKRLKENFNNPNWETLSFTLPHTLYTPTKFFTEVFQRVQNIFKDEEESTSIPIIPIMLVENKNGRRKSTVAKISSITVAEYMTKSEEFAQQLNAHVSLIRNNHEDDSGKRRSSRLLKVQKELGERVSLAMNLLYVDVQKLDIQEEIDISKNYGATVIGNESSEEEFDDDDDETFGSSDEEEEAIEEDVETVMKKKEEKKAKARKAKWIVDEVNRKDRSELDFKYLIKQIKKKVNAPKGQEWPTAEQDRNDSEDGPYRQWLEYKLRMDSDFNSILEDSNFVKGWFKWMIQSDRSRLLHRLATSQLDLSLVQLCLGESLTERITINQAVIRGLKEQAHEKEITISTYDVDAMWNALVADRLHLIPQVLMTIMHQVVIDARFMPSEYFLFRYGFRPTLGQIKYRLRNYINQLNLWVKDRSIKTTSAKSSFSYMTFNDEWLTDSKRDFISRIRAHWTIRKLDEHQKLDAKKTKAYKCIAQQEIYIKTMIMFSNRLAKRRKERQTGAVKYDKYEIPCFTPRLHATFSSYNGDSKVSFDFALTYDQISRLEEFSKKFDMVKAPTRTNFTLPSEEEEYINNLPKLNTDQDLFYQWGIVTVDYKLSMISALYATYTIRYAADILGVIFSQMHAVKKPVEVISYVFLDAESRVLDEYKTIPGVFVRQNDYWTGVMTSAGSSDPSRIIAREEEDKKSGEGPRNAIKKLLALHNNALKTFKDQVAKVVDEVTNDYNEFVANEQLMYEIRTGVREVPTLASKILAGVRKAANDKKDLAMQGQLNDAQKAYAYIGIHFANTVTEQWLKENGQIETRETFEGEKVESLVPYLNVDMLTFDEIVKSSRRLEGSYVIRDMTVGFRRVSARNRRVIALPNRVLKLQKNILTIQRELGITVNTKGEALAFQQLFLGNHLRHYVPMIACLSKPSFLLDMGDGLDDLCWSDERMLATRDRGEAEEIEKFRREKISEGSCAFLEPDVISLEELVYSLDTASLAMNRHKFAKLAEKYNKQYPTKEQKVKEIFDIFLREVEGSAAVPPEIARETSVSPVPSVRINNSNSKKFTETLSTGGKICHEQQQQQQEASVTEYPLPFASSGEETQKSNKISLKKRDYKFTD